MKESRGCRGAVCRSNLFTCSDEPAGVLDCRSRNSAGQPDRCNCQTSSQGHANPILVLNCQKERAGTSVEPIEILPHRHGPRRTGPCQESEIPDSRADLAGSLRRRPQKPLEAAPAASWTSTRF